MIPLSMRKNIPCRLVSFITARYDIVAIPNIILIETTSRHGMIPKRSTKNPPIIPNSIIDMIVSIVFFVLTVL